MPESLASAANRSAREKKEEPSCAVLVMSCDAYSDLWLPFFNLFWRYWSDCPWPVYLGTNYRLFADERVTSLRSEHTGWTQCLRFCLNQIDSDFVLLLLEDYFLDRPVSTPLVSEKLITLADLRGAQLRLFPLPGPNRKLSSHPSLGLIHRNAEYRVSTQAAFWKRTHLLDLLMDGESPWDFEWNATNRSRRLNAAHYGTYKPLIHYRHVIERGEWFRAAVRYFENQQIGCDFTARPIMSRSRALKRFLTTTIRYWKLRITGRLRSRQ